MAGSARYTAILDANTLYPAPVCDALLSLAVAGLYHDLPEQGNDGWNRSAFARISKILEYQLG